MSNTYRTKKWCTYKRKLRQWYASDSIGQRPWWDSPEFSDSIFIKKPHGESKTAKFIIQFMGNKRRRTAELKVKNELNKLWVYDLAWMFDHEEADVYDYEKELSRKWSDRWDYY